MKYSATARAQLRKFRKVMSRCEPSKTSRYADSVPAGELQITRALRLELSGTGVRVSSIDPGLAETEFSLVRFKGDGARAGKTYEGMNPLKAEDIAEILVWVANRPPHVNIDEMLIKPVDQAAMHKIYRRPKVN